MKLSRNLNLSEVTKSQTAVRLGIDNSPNQEELENLKMIAVELFQPCRDHIGGPLYVSSGFRSPKLNAAIGGSKTSSHMKAEALDLDCHYFGVGSNAELFNFIRENLEFDQLIWEFGNDHEPAWVHVSKTKGKNRGEVLKAYKGANRRTKYKFI